MKLEQLTFTRYLAALTVVFFHYGLMLQATPASNTFWGPVLSAGPVAVSYFFVLSGFIMAVAYYGTHRPFTKGQYWLARFARIYPVYLMALILVTAVAFASQLPERTPGVATVFLNTLMLQAWIPAYAMTLNTPGWSLSVEAFFYLLFPFLLFWVKKDQARTLWIAGLLLWTLTQVLQISLIQLPQYTHPSTLHNFIFYHPLMHIGTFMLGLVVGIYFCDGKLDYLGGKCNGFLLLITALLLILLLAYRETLSYLLNLPIHYENGLLAPLFLILIVLLAQNRGWIKKLFSLPLLVILGEASYSLYILQRPIYGLYERSLMQMLPDNSNIRFYGFVILLTLVSVISFYLFETPLRRFINRLYSLSEKSG